MIGRRALNMLSIAFVGLTAYFIRNKEEPVIMSLHSNDAVPLLDPYTQENAIEVNLMFPHVEAGFSHLLIQATGSMIRCNYDSPNDLNALSHTIFLNPNLNFTAYPCIEVLQEISLYGLDADIRKAAAFYQDVNFTQKHPGPFYNFASARLVQLNTANIKGICVQIDKQQTCIPSLHITDFNFVTQPTEALEPNRWKGTIQEVVSSSAKMLEDLTISAEKACQLLKKTGVEKHPMSQCIKRTEFAVKELMRSIKGLSEATREDPTRRLSHNHMVLFANNASKSSANTKKSNVVAEDKNRVNPSRSQSVRTI